VEAWKLELEGDKERTRGHGIAQHLPPLLSCAININANSRPYLLSINKLSTFGFGKLLPRYLSMAPVQVTQWMTKNYPRPRVDPV
jgi:hypothetical protein